MVAFIEEKLATFKAEVMRSYQEMEEKKYPAPILERAKIAVDAAQGADAIYFENVWNSFLVSLKSLFEFAEDFMTVNSESAAPFKTVLEKEDPKNMKVFQKICDGVNEAMYDTTRIHMCVPQGVPEELAELLMILSGGNPAMSLEEMEQMIDLSGSEEDWDDDED